MGIRGTLLNIFSESPFKLIYEHMHKSVQTAGLLTRFFEAALLKKWDQAKKVQKEISLLESEADQLQKQINRRLHSDMFLPISRYDLLSLVKSQDSIANQSEDIAGYVLGREMSFPSPMHDDIISFVGSSMAVCDEALHIVGRLEVVMQSGFTGPCVDEVEKMADNIHSLEHENDLNQVNLRELLREHEKSLDPVDVMFMYKVLERIGNIADSAHHVGEKFTLMLVSM